MREEGREEADAAPACTNGGGDEEGHADDAFGEPVEEGRGGFEEGFVSEEGEGAVDEGEEAEEVGEGAGEVFDISACARGVSGVE